MMSTQDVMLPAVAQGAIGIEIREDNDAEMAARLQPINDTRTETEVAAERAFLAKCWMAPAARPSRGLRGLRAPICLSGAKC